jgi:excinuclease UvrABC helicase subunit UvrB
MATKKQQGKTSSGNKRDAFNQRRRHVYSAKEVAKAMNAITKSLRGAATTIEFATQHGLDPNTVRKAAKRLAAADQLKVKRVEGRVQMARAKLGPEEA